MPPFLRLTLPFISACARSRSTLGFSGGNIARHQLPNSAGNTATGSTGVVGTSALGDWVVGVGVGVGVAVTDGDGEADGEAVAEALAEALADAVADAVSDAEPVGAGSAAPAPGADSSRAPAVRATKAADPAVCSPRLRNMRPNSTIELSIEPSSPETTLDGYTGVRYSVSTRSKAARCEGELAPRASDKDPRRAPTSGLVSARGTVGSPSSARWPAGIVETAPANNPA